jgi:phosphoglycolate phosphatase-like HAD superfamily hydrolase
MTQPAPSARDTPAAVVFDVDGTLVDTVYQHVIAWWESFQAEGYAVSCFDIHRAIGRGSHDLVETLLGHPDERVVAGHSVRWGDLRERCQAFHGVPELLRHCRDRGLTVILATSGAQEDLDFFVRAIGGDEPVSAIVSSGDVERSKPAPELVELALRKAGVDASDAVLVGDSVHDAQAAARAGVACIGVLCGGIGEQELLAAGACGVYGNPAELLEGFDRSPLVIKEPRSGR